MRGLDLTAATETIPNFMSKHDKLKDFEKKSIYLPLHPWHDGESTTSNSYDSG